MISSADRGTDLSHVVYVQVGTRRQATARPQPQEALEPARCDIRAGRTASGSNSQVRVAYAHAPSMRNRHSARTWRLLVIGVLISSSGCGALGPSNQVSGAGTLSSPTLMPQRSARSSLPSPAPATPAPVVCPEPLSVSPVRSPDPIASPAVDGILAMYADVSIVAIGERHGWRLLHDFFAQLVCDPRFARTVDDVVVEFGNSRLQPIIDAYVNGEEVATTELASVWRESTQRSGVWDNPVYAKFFGLIRAVNAGLPAEQRIRVLAGDPPVDYSTVTRFNDCSDLVPTCYEYWIQRRDRNFAEVVTREVTAKGRTALLIAGAGHFMRGNPDDPEIAQMLDVDYAAPTFVVLPHLGFGVADPVSEARFDGWPIPGIARLNGTWLGALDACLLEADVGSQPSAPCAGAQTIRDVADAYLYLGYP